MAKIRRWFQFGILDLLMLTTIVAAVVVLWRPPRIETFYEPLAEGTTPGQPWWGNGLRMKFRWCPPGSFKMGSPADEPDRFENEEQVSVTLSRGFWLGKYEVTQGQYRQVMNDNPSYFPGASGASPADLDADYLPVENVTWYDAVAFCRALTEQERKAGRLPADWEYRLPTEAQWEYACRAGTQTVYSFGDDESWLVDFAWYDKNSENRTHEVGQKLPNAWGLHDLHGNVWEWCRDWYQAKLVGGTDPEVTERASGRVLRGGSWIALRIPTDVEAEWRVLPDELFPIPLTGTHEATHPGRDCRSASRNGYEPGTRFVSLGFRVVAVQQAEPGERSESK